MLQFLCPREKFDDQCREGKGNAKPGCTCQKQLTIRIAEHSTFSKSEAANSDEDDRREDELVVEEKAISRLEKRHTRRSWPTFGVGYKRLAIDGEQFVGIRRW